MVTQLLLRYQKGASELAPLHMKGGRAINEKSG